MRTNSVAILAPNLLQYIDNIGVTSMTTILQNKKVWRKDCDGNLYAIPENMTDSFRILNEVMIESELGSNEWYDARVQFADSFDCYQRI